MHNKTKTNTELPQTMGSSLNNRSTTTEPQPQNGQQPRPPAAFKELGKTCYNRICPSFIIADAYVQEYISSKAFYKQKVS